MKYILFFKLFIILVLTACTDNQIFFDKKSKSIISCNNHKLTLLEIINKNTSVVYYYKSIDYKYANDTIYLFKSNINYTLSTIFNDSIGNRIKLNSNTIYSIVNISDGDAMEISIDIHTGTEGEIIYFDRKKCY